MRIENSPGYYNMSIIGFVIQHGIGYLYNPPDRAGGGLFIEDSYINIEDCIIQFNNVNHVGGGVVLSNSYLNLSGSTIRHNSAYNTAGGMLIGGMSSFVNFNTDDLTNPQKRFYKYLH